MSNSIGKLSLESLESRQMLAADVGLNSPIPLGCDLSEVAESTVLTPIPGDANQDGVFDSSDWVRVFQSGEYEDDVVGNSTWAEGDWDGDGDFTSGDMVKAMQTGAYEKHPPGQNPLDPCDVDRDGYVSPRDIVLIINEVHRHRPKQLIPLDEVYDRANWLDADGDGYVSTADAQDVIDCLRQNGELGGGCGCEWYDAYDLEEPASGDFRTRLSLGN